MSRLVSFPWTVELSPGDAFPNDIHKFARCLGMYPKLSSRDAVLKDM